MASMWETTPLEYAITFGLVLEHKKNHLPETLYYWDDAIAKANDSFLKRSPLVKKLSINVVTSFEHCCTPHRAWQRLRRRISRKNPNGPKSVQTSWHVSEGWFPTYHGSWYTILNLPLMAITTQNGFRIGACIKEIRGVRKYTLGLNNPVLLRSIFQNGCFQMCLEVVVLASISSPSVILTHPFWNMLLSSSFGL